MKKAYWANTAVFLAVCLGCVLLSAPAQAEDPSGEDSAYVAYGPGIAVMPYPTHMELILDRFMRDPGRFIGAQVNPDEYIVGPGDVFMVLFVSDDIADIGVRISATGGAFIKSVGEIQVTGRILKDALETIGDAVRTIYTRADFTVQLAAYRFVRVDVIGEVAQPGTYYVPGFWRTSEAIELAGGLTPRASSREIRLRGENRFAILDMVRFMATGDVSANPMISGGHTIVVPGRESGADCITVSGLVRRPGTFAAVDGEIVADYLEYAGGVRGPLHEMEMLISNPVAGKSAILDGGRGSDLNVSPHPGDNIVVRWKADHGSRGTVMIFGAVERPGRYPLRDTEFTIEDLLQACGGMSAEANPELMRVYRIWHRPESSAGGLSGYKDMQDKEAGDSSSVTIMTGERTVVSSNPRRPLDPKEFALRDGDSLYVPRATGMVSVLGAVSSPGLVSHKQGQSVSYYLDEVGGLRFDADRDRTVIVDPITGAAFSAATAGELFDGEIIYVPRKESNTKP